MSDHPKIPPALSSEEWANLANVGYFDWPHGIIDVSYQNADFRNLPAKLIGIANAALPDSDPRKITREKVNLVRAAAGLTTSRLSATALRAVADALASYLPPETK